jgi:hypothetical protein
MTTVEEKLIAAREKIADPKHWIKEEMAVDFEGMPCDAQSAHAVGWCALGALCAVTECFSGALSILQRAVGYTSSSVYSLSRFNDADSTTHEDMLALFDRAIESAHESVL